jgi:hypothetical protein
MIVFRNDSLVNDCTSANRGYSLVSPLLAPCEKAMPTLFCFGDRPTGRFIICGTNNNRKA